MFERYTEPARRMIFFARFEASASGSAEITPTHLLLGLLREGPLAVAQFLPAGTTIETLRTELIAAQPAARASVASSADVPLSLASKRVLAWTAAESEHLEHRHIDLIHVLLALFSDTETGTFLTSHGIDRDQVQEIAATGEAPAQDRRILIDGNEVSISESVVSGAEPGSVEYSVTVRAFGEERSWKTTLRSQPPAV